jgi:hypothetical protein
MPGARHHATSQAQWRILSFVLVNLEVFHRYPIADLFGCVSCSVVSLSEVPEVDVQEMCTFCLLNPSSEGNVNSWAFMGVAKS